MATFSYAVSGVSVRQSLILRSSRALVLLSCICVSLFAFGSTAQARNEVQTITLSNVTAASIAITSSDYTGSSTFAPGATAATVQAALEAKFGTGTVSVAGSSTVGLNLSLNATVSGTASAPALLKNGATNDSCVFVRDASGNEYVDFDLGASNAVTLSQFRAFVVSAASGGQPRYLMLYGSNTGNFNTDGVQLNNFLTFSSTAMSNQWQTIPITSVGTYRYYRAWYQGGGGTTSPLTLGELELDTGAGYYGTYTVTFGGSRGHINVASMATTTTGVAIATTTEGAKEWTVGSAIAGGRMTAPQDQTVSPATPASVTVTAGGTLNLSVEAATDSDHWDSAGASGDSADTVSYTWTADAANPAIGTFANAATNSATWTAPATTGTYVLKCTVNDGGTVPTGDAGVRDDTPAIVRTVTVAVAAPAPTPTPVPTPTPTPPPVPPAAPIGLTATQGNHQVALAWSAVTGATGYTVKRAAATGGPYTTLAGVTGASYTDTTAANGTTYYYVVSASGIGGEGANSNEASATPDGTAPTVAITAPANDAWLTTLGSVSGTASDNTGGTGVQAVTLELKNSAGQYWSTATASWVAGQTSIATTYATGGWGVTTGLPAGATLPDGIYTLKATGTDAAGNSADSITATVTVDTAAPQLSLSLGTGPLPEGGTLNGTVTRNKSKAAALTVQLASSDTTAATVPATVTILAGQASATFTISGVDDEVVDGDQTATLTASSTGYADGTATVTVVDDEAGPIDALVRNGGDAAYLGKGILNATGAGQTKNQTVAGNVTASYDIKVYNHSASSASLTLKTNESAGASWTVQYLQNGVDITADITGINGWTTPAPIASGGSVEIMVKVTPDETVAADATKTIKVTVTTDADATASDTVATITTKSGAAVPRTLALSFNANTVAEGGTLTGTVTRSTATSAALTVSLSSSDTTEATVPATVTIPANQVSIDFTLTGVDDNITDGNQTVTISASATGFAGDTEDVTVTDIESGAVDALIRQSGDAAYLGANIINADGTNQTKSASVAANTTATYDVKVFNRDDAGSYLTLKAVGPTAENWTVQYLQGETDITAAITGTNGWTTAEAVAAGEAAEVTVKVTPDETVAANDVQTVTLTATTDADTNASDVVVASTTKTGAAVPAYRPDAMIRNAGETSYTGTDTYNDNGTGQSKNQASLPGFVSIYHIKVQNNSGGATPLTVMEIPPPLGVSTAGWMVKYYKNLDVTDHTVANDITEAVTTTGWSTPSLAVGATYELRAEVTSATAVATDAVRELLIKTILPTNTSRIDVVKASTTRTRELLGLEYGYNGYTWAAAPTDSANAVELPEGVILGLHADKANPNTDWPVSTTDPYFKPTWSNDGEELVGDPIWVGYDDASGPDGDIKNITAECADTVGTVIKVIPNYRVKVTAQPSAANDGTLAVKATVANWVGKIEAGAHVHFTATYDDHTVAGSFGDSGNAVTDAAGVTTCTWTPGTQVSHIHFVATVVNSSGTALMASPETISYQGNTTNTPTASSPAQPAPPSAPTAAGGAVTDTTAVVSWTANNDLDFEEYEIYRSTTSGFTPGAGNLLFSSIWPDVISFTDTDLEPSTTYYYKVVAVDLSGSSAPSNVATVTTTATPTPPPIPTPPPPPAAVTLTAGTTTHTTVAISWTKSLDADFDSYEIHRSTTANFTPSDATLLEWEDDSASTSYTDSGLMANTTYYYKVVVMDGYGQETASNGVSATAATSPVTPAQPAAATLSAATPTLADQLSLSWTQSQEGDFCKYELHRADTASFTPSDSNLQAVYTSSATTSQVDGALTPGMTYHYKLVVINDTGQATASNEVSVTMPTVSAPAAVTLTAGTATAATASVSWTQSTDTYFSYYELYRSTTQGLTATSGTLINTAFSAGTVQATDITADSGVTYYYKVVVYNRFGQSSASNEVSLTTITMPTTVGQPTAVTLSAGTATGTSVPLSWTQNQDTDFLEYDLFRSETQGVAPAEGTYVRSFWTANTLQVTDTGLEPGKTYYYTLVAQNTMTGSTASNEVAVTTAG